jgi:hypothetical protein
MLFRKNKLDKFSKNISAHDRAHDLHALMSGAFFDGSKMSALMISISNLIPIENILISILYDKKLSFLKLL